MSYTRPSWVSHQPAAQQLMFSVGELADVANMYMLNFK